MNAKPQQKANSTSQQCDDAFLMSAIKQANLNALRMALYQLTGDPEFAAMEVEPFAIRGGALFTMVVAEKNRGRMIEKAFEILKNIPERPAQLPSKDRVRELMTMFSGQELSEADFQYGFEELALEDFPRDVKWNQEPDRKKLQDYKITIVGAGISGIAVAILLERIGIPYKIIERRPGLGGTWWINDYPEARVDTSSFLYQFRFEKNYPWSEFFASRDETLKYLNHVAVKYGILGNIQFSTELISAKWDESTSHWRCQVRQPDGVEREERANVLISAMGLFATPKLPDIEGIADFQGKMFHTTAWDHGYDYSGKRIALIGNGSTGTQLMPRIARVAKSVTAFQRTPNWIQPVENYRGKITPEIRWLFDNVPYYWNWFGYSIFVAASSSQELQAHDREWQEQGGRISGPNDKVRAALTQYIRDKVGDDAELFEKCLPMYAPMARRLVVDNGWYDALRRDNVELITARIERFTPMGIRTVDGVEREFDLVILGAGFDVNRFLWPVKYEGREGATLEKSWRKDGARSYLGMTMPGYPNFFMFYGPNGQPRSGGFYSWAEVWSRYAVKLIVKMIESGFNSVECKQEVYDDYNRRIDLANKEIIWEDQGQGGYYVNKHGRSSVNLPWRVEQYHAWMVEPDVNDFNTT
jgi:4-hydroxyacetophenone monooxygenase